MNPPDREVLLRQSERPQRWVCPHCGAEMLMPSMLCSGGFLDENHPPNVQPVRAEELDGR